MKNGETIQNIIFLDFSRNGTWDIIWQLPGIINLTNSIFKQSLNLQKQKKTRKELLCSALTTIYWEN